MIGEIGFFFLVLVLVISGFGGGYLLTNYSRNNFLNQTEMQKKITELTFIFALLSFFCLTFSFLISDFSFEVVEKNSNSQLPYIYKFTGVWGNHEGSILLWLLVMTLFGFLFSLSQIENYEFKKNVLGIQNFLCFLVVSFIVFTSNPFKRNVPPSIEGADLNPLLQDPGLAIHPPLLYLGYVGFSIVYSIALSILLCKNNKLKFIKILKPWVLVSWICLTGGIGLGSWWAYYELGWGGFWFWDPVENASLLPWLTASALLHTLVISEKKNLLTNWTIILSIITFSLSLLGTFLVRSGVLVSVHAFASDPTRGVFILLLLSLISGLGIYFFLKNYKIFSDNKQIHLLSREGAISLNNIFLLSLSFTILLGTIYPIISSSIFNSKISVGAPFFNSILSPIMLPFIVGMIIGPYLKWGKDDLMKLTNRLKSLLVTFFFLSIFIWYLNFKGPVISIIFFIMASWILISSLFEVFESMISNYKLRKVFYKIPLKIYAQSLAHIGIALLIIGATGSSILKKEKIQFQSRNEVINIKNFKVKFLGVKTVEGPNYMSQTGMFEIYKNNEFLKIMKPEKRFYNSGSQITTEAAIHSTIYGDLYIAIGDQSLLTKNESWTSRIWFNPFTIWIWIGTLFLVIGGGVSLLRSYR